VVGTTNGKVNFHNQHNGLTVGGTKLLHKLTGLLMVFKVSGTANLLTKMLGSLTSI